MNTMKSFKAILAVLLFASTPAFADFGPMGYSTAKLIAVLEALNRAPEYQSSSVKSARFTDEDTVSVRLGSTSGETERQFIVTEKSGCGFSFCGFNVVEGAR